ncbi:TonB-dependent receptor [Flavobacterium sp. 9AF]|uniref:TonB-dependent receptor plug domain-containing protein n=1 Tax=Flavobacterium sp. 9AF TaxID=2653142 RepID=UPI0012F3B223|nr:TonB-dependent receptor [Flavobacterium sp. 9AF]VXB17304.1 TonB-dependent receptor [Flavobacterium sp. 9AF]
MKKIFHFCLLTVTIPFYGQSIKDSIKTKRLEEVIVTSTKIPKNKTILPNEVESINKKQIEFQNFQTTSEMLSNSGALFVQKSQQGGGSPTIRGFEASRVLLLVDGFRMNNLIFRTGHLQNVITVDENMLENVDIFYGPTSTLFGSDALGGTINMTTKKANFFDETHSLITGNITTRYGSVNKEKSISFDINFAKENFASLTVFSFNDFEDLKMGKSKNHHSDLYGERYFYVENSNGIDQLVANENKYIQKFSGYTQYNVLQKVSYKSRTGLKHNLNLQYSTTSNIPRYDRLTDVTSSGLRNVEWYYGPQKRILTAYTLEKSKAFFDSNLILNLAYQNAKESRHNRRFQNYNLQNREENVNMYSFSFDLNRKFRKGELFYGLESYFETLKSSAYLQNINTGETNGLDTRYPNGNNNMFRNDIYISYTEQSNTKTSWSTGGRFGVTTLNSAIADDTYFPLPFTQIKQSNFTYSGSIGIVHKTSPNVALKTNLASGFRVPNVDDFGKIFESGGGFLIVPNENLKPEKTITGDLGLIIQSNNKRFKFENTFYYTRLFDAIITDAFEYQGQSQINYDGTLSSVLANQNKGRAFITGLSTIIKGYILNELQFEATFNYTYGRIIEEKEKPLDHVSPYFGKLNLSYEKKWGRFDFYMLYNGKKRSKDYFLNGEDNEQYAPQGGMPAWETYNFKTSFSVLKQATLYFGVENIFDTQYRVFASGINAPGRNIYSGLKYNF